MLPTLGLYRFWQATWKRRFYWQNTSIDGAPLEYTGTPSQLLIGFFFALAFFLPIYIALFVLSMQDSRYVAPGAMSPSPPSSGSSWATPSIAPATSGLSRTLWRGIRFDQKGSAFAYGVRRFLWSILMVVTVGLVYPWMASSLWRYRWRNTWYGDRHFDIAGRWTAFAGPYFATWFLNALTIGSAIAWITVHRDLQRLGTVVLPGPVGLGCCALCVVVFALTLAGYRTTTVSRMLSTVSLGEARISVRLGFAALLGQFVAYVVGIVLVLLLLPRSPPPLRWAASMPSPPRTAARSMRRWPICCSRARWTWRFSSPPTSWCSAASGCSPKSCSASAGGGCWRADRPSPTQTVSAACAPRPRTAR